MSDEPSTNGTTTPCTPKLSGLSLTEYAANPTPPSERADPKLPPDWGVPEDFLLPNGYPDVRNFTLRKCPDVLTLTVWNFEPSISD